MSLVQQHSSENSVKIPCMNWRSRSVVSASEVTRCGARCWVSAPSGPVTSQRADEGGSDLAAADGGSRGTRVRRRAALVRSPKSISSSGRHLAAKSRSADLGGGGASRTILTSLGKLA